MSKKSKFSKYQEKQIAKQILDVGVSAFVMEWMDTPANNSKNRMRILANLLGRARTMLVSEWYGRELNRKARQRIVCSLKANHSYLPRGIKNRRQKSAFGEWVLSGKAIQAISVRLAVPSP